MNTFTAALAIVMVMLGCIRVTDTQITCATAGCLNGVCRTDQPSPGCQCFPGLVLSPVDDTICVDFNECAIAFGTICNHGKCINSFGGFQCQCAMGYIARYNNTYCDDPPQRTYSIQQQQQQRRPPMNNYYNYLLWDEMS